MLTFNCPIFFFCLVTFIIRQKETRRKKEEARKKQATKKLILYYSYETNCTKLVLCVVCSDFFYPEIETKSVERIIKEFFDEDAHKVWLTE